MTLILLVDPDDDTRDIVGTALKSRGYEILATGDGVAGLRLARERRPALIIGDFPMDVPGESPFTGAVRNDPRLTGTRILALTARAMDDEVQAARRASDAVLLKPVEPTEVIAEVRRLLGEESTTTAEERL